MSCFGGLANAGFLRYTISPSSKTLRFRRRLTTSSTCCALNRTARLKIPYRPLNLSKTRAAKSVCAVPRGTRNGAKRRSTSLASAYPVLMSCAESPKSP